MTATSAVFSGQSLFSRYCREKFVKMTAAEGLRVDELHPLLDVAADLRLCPAGEAVLCSFIQSVIVHRRLLPETMKVLKVKAEFFANQAAEIRGDCGEGPFCLSNKATIRSFYREFHLPPPNDLW